MIDDEAQRTRARAAAALDVRRPEDARRLLAPLLASNPDDAEAFALMAVASARCGEPPTVWRGYADRAAALEPFDADLLATLADLGRTSGDPAAGAYFAERALIVAPHHVRALNVLGLLQIDSNPGKALATIERALESRPDNPDLLVARGMALARQGQRAASQAMYVAALEQDPRNVYALNNLAFARLRCADLPRASRLLHRAVVEDPHTVLFRKNMDAVGSTTRRLTIAALMVAINVFILVGLANRWLGAALSIGLGGWVVFYVARLPAPVLRRLGKNLAGFDAIWAVYLLVAIPHVISVATTGAVPSFSAGLFLVLAIGLRVLVPFVVRRMSVSAGLRRLGVRLP